MDARLPGCRIDPPPPSSNLPQPPSPNPYPPSCDLGTADEVALDILINLLIGFSRDVAGIRRITFGGAELNGWDTPEQEDDIRKPPKVGRSGLRRLGCAVPVGLWVVGGLVAPTSSITPTTTHQTQPPPMCPHPTTT